MSARAPVTQGPLEPNHVDRTRLSRRILNRFAAPPLSGATIAAPAASIGATRERITNAANTSAIVGRSWYNGHGDDPDVAASHDRPT